jgi:hypothetical protein
MVITRANDSTLQLKAALAENSRPFLWVGILCAAYGYIPHALYDVPVLFYLGVGMTALSLGLRALAGPLIAALRAVERVRSGELAWSGLARQLLLLAVLVAASLGGTALLGHLFSQLAG